MLRANSEKPPVSFGSYRRVYALALELSNRFKAWDNWLCDDFIRMCVCVCVCVCIIRCISALLCHSLVKAL